MNKKQNQPGPTEFDWGDIYEIGKKRFVADFVSTGIFDFIKQNTVPIAEFQKTNDWSLELFIENKTLQAKLTAAEEKLEKATIKADKYDQLNK